MKKQAWVIAIDGPAGTGKSSVTRRLAEALHFRHIDTGALYRAIATVLLDRGLALDSQEFAEAASELAETAHLEFRFDLKATPSNRIYINGVDVTSRIRTPEVSLAASKASSFPRVRSALLGLQRKLGGAGRSILEGRDIGTVIFPDADVKFFLTATIEERTKRRLAELEATGADVPSYEQLREQITRRDHDDATRAIAPLKKAEGAIEVDTSLLTLDEVVAWMEARVRERLPL